VTTTVVPLREFTVDKLRVSVYPDRQALGAAAAAEAAAVLREAIAVREEARVILASANSQLDFLHALPDEALDWERVRAFHMDEYLGLPVAHPAGFATFLQRELFDRVQAGEFCPIEGRPQSVVAECARYEALLRRHPADLCCLGIGENGHVAFNEPHIADFEDPVLVKTVRLDERSRQQQVGEGHYPSLAEVPTHAITLTVPALMAAKHLVCIVPESRKAEAVRRTLTGPIEHDCPATALRRHANAHLLLDQDSASLLD
jgi:glucosamine-6-phosphate deaminase